MMLNTSLPCRAEFSKARPSLQFHDLIGELVNSGLGGAYARQWSSANKPLPVVSIGVDPVSEAACCSKVHAIVRHLSSPRSVR